jgi:hypothetical protein
MQSDAFPTPPIFVHQFQPLIAHHFEPQPKCNFSHLLNEITLLMNDCSITESESGFFWQTTDYLKAKYSNVQGIQAK